MGINRSPTDRPLVGVLVPEPRLAFWPAQSTLDEASPFPGAATPGRATDLSLTASGTPEQLDTLDVLAQSSGVPELGGASFVWRESGDVAYRGWDFPHALVKFDSPTWSTTTTAGRRFLDLAKTTADTIVFVSDFPNTAAGSEQRRVSVNRRLSNGTYGGWTTIYTDTSVVAGSDFMLHPTINRLPDDTLEVYCLTHDHDAQRMQVVRLTSTDDGVTWSTSDRACLEVTYATSGAPRRTPTGMRVRHHAGQHLLVIDSEFVGGTSRRQDQYASRDGGGRFEAIGNLANLHRSRIVVAGGYFLVAYADVSGAPQNARVRRIASAYTPLTTANAVSVATNATLVEPAAIVVDEGQRVYFLLRLADDLDLFVSDDLGATWASGGAFLTHSIPSTSSNLRRGDAVFWRGQLFYGGNHDQGTGDNSFVTAQFGGYTNLCLPRTIGSGIGAARQAAWSRHWVAIDDMQALDSNWTVTDVGGGAPTIADGFATFVGGAGLFRGYQFLDANNLLPAMARATIGGTVGSPRLLVRISNNVDAWEARAQYAPATGTITLTDVFGVVDIASAVVAALSTVEIMIGVAAGTAGAGNGEAALFYRLRDSASDDREWTFLAATDALVNGGAGQGVRRVRYHTDDAPGAYDNTLFDLAIAFGFTTSPANFQTPVGAGLHNNPANPADLRGREFANFPVYVHDGVSISAFGLSRGGDTWTIIPRHTYEAEQVLPGTQPSPALGWRSLTGGSKTIAFQLFTANSHATSDLYGIYLDKINFRRFRLETRQAGVWNDRGTFTLSTQVGYQRIGDIIIPRETGTTQTGNVYFRRDETRDGVFEFENLTTVRSILANGPGSTDRGPIDEFRPWWRLSGITGAEPVGPIAGAEIWYPRALVTFAFEGNNEMDGIRLVINPGGTDPNPPTGDIRIGTLAMGPVQVLGWDPDETRSLALSLDGDLVTYQRDGSAVREVIAPQYRRLEVSWARTSWLGEVQRTGDPDYVTASTNAAAEPVGTRHGGGPYDMEGILRQVGRQPIVYLPRIDRDAAATHTYLSGFAAGAVYGRFVPESFRIETVTGNAEQSEFVRSSVVTIQEER